MRSDPDALFDLMRGVATLTREPIVDDLARTITRFPDADLSIAFNHKQIGGKMWARDMLAATLGANLGRVVVLGGWYGVLSALLLGAPGLGVTRERGLGVTRATSVDIDPACAPVARCLNARHEAAGRFSALTGDMRALDWGDGVPDLLVNTSCEHLADVPGWLATVPAGTMVMLQSNDYVREPDHRSCVPDLDAFVAQACLRELLFKGARPTKNYTRFMLIGRR